MKLLLWICKECKTPCYAQYVGKGKSSGKFIKPECCHWDESRVNAKWLLKKVGSSDVLEHFMKYQT